MNQTEIPYYEAAILNRLATEDEAEISAEAAEGILSLHFSSADKNRMHELSKKARDGSITSDEQVEVEAYSRIGSLLGVLKSRARRTIKRATAESKAITN